MSFDDRVAIIRRLEEIQDSCVITHINSDRRSYGLLPPAVNTKLATEAQLYFYKTLKRLGKQRRIDLFLYTTGGQTDSVWPLVSLLREFSDEFNVLVPYKSHSAGTLICLGADKVILGEASELSPVDPTTGNVFNPQEELVPEQRKPISVEDVTSFFALSKNPSKTSNNKDKDDKVSAEVAFKSLVEKVHPLALGNVNRSHTQIRELTRRLLYMNAKQKDDAKIEAIVNTLTQGRYSHTDILNRKEVRDLLGSEVVEFANDEVQVLLWQLFLEYEEALALDKPFIINSFMGNERVKELKITGSFIETRDSSYVFRSNSEVQQYSAFPQGYQITLQPGQGPPFIPGFPVNFNLTLKELGWSENLERL